MSEVRQDTVVVLEHVADRLAAAPLPGDLAEDLRKLARDVYAPCVVAIVGLVKAGKSSLINALLGTEAAVVGTTETTATINHFVYGRPDPARPVRCHYRNGKVTEVDAAFLAGLQGNDIETLRRADGIESLEYLMPHPWLERLTIVDTPGLGAAVGEHEGRALEFLRLRDELRRRHDADTRRLHETADAVIYLVGPVAMTGDRELLEQFRDATGGASSARNALGLLAKVDLDEQLLARRAELAEKIAGQLARELNTVLPVSAGLAMAAEALAGPARGSLRELRDMLTPLADETLETLLADEELFCELDVDGCSTASADRKALRLSLGWQWSVFRTVAQLAAQPALSDADVVARVAELGGFDALRAVLRRHFLERAEIIRCFRVVRDAHRLVQSIRFEHLPRLRRETSGSRDRLERYVAFAEAAGGDRAVADELADYLRGQMTPFERIDELEALWPEVDRELATLLHRLGEYNADFEALQSLDENLDDFSAEEVEELRALFGLYGSDAAARLRGAADDLRTCAARQLAWHRVSQRAPRASARRAVGERAYARLGQLMDELMPAASVPSL